MIKGATILEVSRCPQTDDAFGAIFLHNVIREMELCLAPLANIHGWLKTVKLFYCTELFRRGKALGSRVQT